MSLKKILWIACGVALLLWIILAGGLAVFFGIATGILLIAAIVVTIRSSTPILLLDADGEIVTKERLSEMEEGQVLDESFLTFARHILDGAMIDKGNVVFTRDSDGELILLYDIVGDDLYTHGSIYDRELIGELRIVQLFDEYGELVFTIGADVFKRIKPDKKKRA